MVRGNLLEYAAVPTTCVYCGCGCELVLKVLDGKLVGVLPSKTQAVSQGKLCIKGWTAHEFVESEKRLLKPLMKKGNELVEVSWDEALTAIASKFKSVKEESGADSMAVLCSAKATNEENYLIQKWTRAVLGTNNIDHCARL
jgi:predicted molibdopterin-dependent oxidoreductase YjgC